MASAEGTGEKQPDTQTQRTEPGQTHSPIPWIFPGPFGPPPIVVVPVVIPDKASQQQQSQPGGYKPNCQEPKDREDADLCAQWRMAKAAEESVTAANEAVTAARDQAWTAWLAFWGLIGTLIVGAIAAIAAALAARFAAETARVMRNAERPYFTTCDEVLSRWDDLESSPYTPVEVHLAIENVGRGVGFLKAIAIAWEIAAEGTQGTKPLVIRSEFGRIPIRADAIWSAEAACEVFQIPPDERAAILASRQFLYVYGYLRYSDNFGTIRRTGFMFEFVPDREFPAVIGAFVMCPHAMWHDAEDGQEEGRPPQVRHWMPIPPRKPPFLHRVLSRHFGRYS